MPMKLSPDGEEDEVGRRHKTTKAKQRSAVDGEVLGRGSARGRAQ